MRVIAGTARSIPLVTPRGLETRPTTDQIKETLFNMIQFDIPESVFIDLYSGSGAIGIEALSRGAKHAYFVDNSKKAIECIKENINKCKFNDTSTIIARDALDSLYEIHDKADIIFMDPPYEDGHEIDIMKALLNSGIVKDDTTFIIESKIDRDLSELENIGFDIFKVKNYKNNKHTFIKIS